MTFNLALIYYRRFYSRKYDAARTLSAFSSKLHEEMALDRLGGKQISVVKETMQPEHASLWLRPPAGENGAKAR